ncbi:MAG: ROK family glucokinase [Lachnospiraceae bacterium]
MKHYVFGIDIGGTTVKCGLFTTEGELLDKWEIPTNRANGGESVPQDITDALLAKMQEKGIEREQMLGAGVGVPGPVTEDGTVLKCANLGWGIFNVNDKMSSLLGLPVVAANDANVAALGEMWKGGGKGYEDIVMVTLGTGVGGGIILNGKIRAGSNGGAGEIGHMIVNPEETRVCGCGGHGHLEQYASATGITYLAEQALRETDQPSTLRTVEKLQAKDVFDHAKAGDALALSLVDKVCEILATALTHVAATVDPQAFVIGGGVSKAGEILTEGLKKHYGKNLLNALCGKEFRLATLGNDAGIYGSAKLIIDRATGK